MCDKMRPEGRDSMVIEPISVWCTGLRGKRRTYELPKVGTLWNHPPLNAVAEMRNRVLMYGILHPWFHGEAESVTKRAIRYSLRDRAHQVLHSCFPIIWCAEDVDELLRVSK